MTADEFGRSLQGMGINLLVRAVEPAVAFQRDVLGTEILRQNRDFAVIGHHGTVWMLHADHTFARHPLLALTGDDALRGVGVELRLYDRDPVLCEERARRHGYTVLAATAAKPHGLRECVIIDPDGYAWVPASKIVETQP